jgi:predicted Kef-type K+ transport protein
MLTDKKEVDQLHGQIAMGFLIVQDIVVVITMIVLSAFGAGEDDANIGLELLTVLVKGIAFIAAIGLLMKFVIPGVIKRSSGS